MDSRRILNLHMAHHVPVVRVLLLKVEVELDGGAGMWMVRMWEAVDSPGLEKAVGTAALLAFVVCVGRVWCVCLPPFFSCIRAHTTPSPFHFPLTTPKNAKNFLLSQLLRPKNVLVLCYGFCFIHSGKNVVCVIRFSLNMTHCTLKKTLLPISLFLGAASVSLFHTNFPV